MGRVDMVACPGRPAAPAASGGDRDRIIATVLALLADDGHMELRRVAYDHEASAAAVEERYPEEAWAERSARRLRSAQMCE